MQQYLLHQFTFKRYREDQPDIKLPLKLNKELGKSNVSRLPLFFENQMIVPSLDGKIQAYKEGSTELLWEYVIESKYEKIPNNFLQLYCYDRKLAFSLFTKLSVIDLSSQDLLYENTFPYVVSFDFDFIINDNLLIFLKVSKNEASYSLKNLNDNQDLWTIRADHPPHFSLLNGEHLILTTGKNNDYLTCLNFESGKKIWSNKIASLGKYFDPILRANSGGVIQSGAMLFKDMVIVPINGYKIAAFDVKSGTMLWVAETDYIKTNVVVSVEENMLYSLGREYIFRIDPLTGQIINKLPIKDEFERMRIPQGYTYLTITNHHIFFISTRTGILTAINKETGKIDWYTKLSGGTAYWNFPLIINNRLYALTDNGDLFVFESA